MAGSSIGSTSRAATRLIQRFWTATDKEFQKFELAHRQRAKESASLSRHSLHSQRDNRDRVSQEHDMQHSKLRTSKPDLWMVLSFALGAAIVLGAGLQSLT